MIDRARALGGGRPPGRAPTGGGGSQAWGGWLFFKFIQAEGNAGADLHRIAQSRKVCVFAAHEIVFDETLHFARKLAVSAANLGGNAAGRTTISDLARGPPLIPNTVQVVMSPIIRRATTNAFILIWAGIISILNRDLAGFCFDPGSPYRRRQRTRPLRHYE